MHCIYYQYSIYQLEYGFGAKWRKSKKSKSDMMINVLNIKAVKSKWIFKKSLKTRKFSQKLKDSIKVINYTLKDTRGLNYMAKKFLLKKLNNIAIRPFTIRTFLLIIKSTKMIKSLILAGFLINISHRINLQSFREIKKLRYWIKTFKILIINTLFIIKMVILMGSSGWITKILS